MTAELLGYELLILKGFGADELHQRVSEQVRVLAVVVPELHLIEVRRKVTGAEMVVRELNPICNRRVG